VSFKVFPE